MIELAWATAGLLVGGLLAWATARARFAAAAHREREALGMRLAAGETLGDELRKQVSQREREVTDLRGALDAVRASRVQAEERAEAARVSLEAQRHLLEETRDRLSDHFRALSAEALRQSGAEFL